MFRVCVVFGGYIMWTVILVVNTYSGLTGSGYESIMYTNAFGEHYVEFALCVVAGVPAAIFLFRDIVRNLDLEQDVN